jgi:hypothetical protein
MQQGSSRISQKRERQGLIAILIFALLHGTLYLFLIPPWQHYDEPNHFEYVWLVAFRPGLPQQGDYDQSMRREVAISMIDYGFYENLDSRPDLDSPPDIPIAIGPYQQLGEPPLYYIVASIPLSLFNFNDITTQLYAARFVSLLFFLITVCFAYGVMVEITPDGHPLRILVPLSIAMLPSFVDVMTAVNSDAAAVVVFSFFLWGSVRLIQRGFSVLDFVWVSAATVLAYFSKNTAYLTIVLLPAVLILSIFHGKKLRKWAWGILGVAALVGMFMIFSWGDVSAWYRQTNQTITTRMQTELAPHGGHALCIEINAADSKINTQVRQILSSEAIKSIQGEPFTLGGWIWATEPTEIRLPIIESPRGIQSTSKGVSLGVTPAFFIVRGTLPSSINRVWVNMSPLIPKKTSPAIVCYDGFVLIKGKQLLENPPEFHDANGERGIWGDQEFTNLLRNGSMEHSWPWIRPWVENLGTKVIPDKGSPSLVLYTLLDTPSSGWYYINSFYNLARTFWAKFGWAHISLIGHKPYRILGLFTVIGLVGAAVAMWQKRRVLPWDVLIFFAIVLFAVWGMTWVRGSIYFFRIPFIPVARYAYPAIIPTMFVLNLGWLEVLEGLKRWFRLPQGTEIVVYIVLLLILNLVSIASVYLYYS